MSLFLRAFFWLMLPALTAALFAAPVRASQLVYVPLAQPCRLLDTRPSTGGAGPLTAAHGAYLFGTSDADIQSAAQHGSATGCGVSDRAEAVSVNMNLLNSPVSGNIVTWSADAGLTAPNIGTAVYNPTVATPAAGQVQYNTGYTTVPVGSSSQKFFLQVANGQIDMTINVVGYWLSISWGEASGVHAVALGDATKASGYRSTAMGASTTASGDYSTALGDSTTASGIGSTAMGVNTNASGNDSMAMGSETTASNIFSIAIGNGATASGYSSTAIGYKTKAGGSFSTAMGSNTTADGPSSTAIGSEVSTDSYTGSFIYGDANTTRSIVKNTADNQFVTVATGGAYFFSGCGGVACSTGVGLAPGSGSWFSLSDRNAKTAIQFVDGREVLKKVATLPLNTWQYKTQESKYRHMGPMAQDFYAAFQLGESDKSIDTVDADGVALAAIQGLNAELSEKNRQIAALDHEVALLHAQLSAQQTETRAQKKRLAALESLAGEVASLKTQLAARRQSSPAQVTVALTQP